MLSNNDFSALEQIIDTTWGRASTNATPTMSIKMKLVDEETAKIQYTTVITFQGQLSQQEIEHQRSIAESTIDAYLKEIKKQFKQATGSNLKCKLIELEPVVEHIDVNTFSPLRAVRTAYLKCLGLVEM
jgi:hypothetical protein